MSRVGLASLVCLTLCVFVSSDARVSRDATLLAATIEYIRQRSAFDSQKLLAAAKPLVMLAQAAVDPEKRGNLTVAEGLILLRR